MALEQFNSLIEEAYPEGLSEDNYMPPVASPLEELLDYLVENLLPLCEEIKANKGEVFNILHAENRQAGSLTQLPYYIEDSQFFMMFFRLEEYDLEQLGKFLGRRAYSISNPSCDGRWLAERIQSPICISWGSKYRHPRPKVEKIAFEQRFNYLNTAHTGSLSAKLPEDQGVARLLQGVARPDERSIDNLLSSDDFDPLAILLDEKSPDRELLKGFIEKECEKIIV